MSLLQEAIRKAERAREEAQRPGKRAELSPVPLEIVAEPDAAPPSPPLAVEPGWAFESSPPPEARQAESAGAGPEEPSAADQKRAVLLALTGVAAVAIAVYFWFQLRPAPAVAKPGATRPVAAAPLTAAPPPSTPTEPPKPSNSNSVLLPGLPPSAPAELPRTEPAPRAAPPPAAAKPIAKTEPLASERATPSPTAPRSSPIARTAPAIHPRVHSGYTAYQAGDLVLARNEYQEALKDDAGNRDALLGIAAVESRAGRTSEAESHYRRLLQADPRDAHAHAGLLALRAQRIDPLQAETRIKTLLANDPEAGALLFSLGNQYARQGRWDEAQLAYAKASAADTGNADFAFNRAISLDHLRQRAAALEQYRLALELASTRAAHFPLESARERIEQLSR